MSEITQEGISPAVNSFYAAQIHDSQLFHLTL